MAVHFSKMGVSTALSASIKRAGGCSGPVRSPVAAERRAGRDRAAGRSGRSSRPGGRSGASGRCSPQRAVRLHGGKRGRAALMDGGACLPLPRPSTERRHACAPPVPKTPRAPPERWRACAQVRDGPSMGRRVQRAASTSPEPPNEAEATSILGCVAPPGRAAGDLRTLPSVSGDVICDSPGDVVERRGGIRHAITGWCSVFAVALDQREMAMLGHRDAARCGAPALPAGRGTGGGEAARGLTRAVEALDSTIKSRKPEAGSRKPEAGSRKLVMRPQSQLRGRTLD